MANTILTLDDILEEANQSRLIWEIDDRHVPAKKYKFILNEADVDSLFEEFAERLSGMKPSLDFLEARMKKDHREFYMVLGYRRHSEDRITDHIKDVIIGKSYYHNLNPFVRIYMVPSDSTEATRTREKILEGPPKGNVVIIFDDLNSMNTESRPYFTGVMEKFIEAYKTIKTPSRTLAAR